MAERVSIHASTRVGHRRAHNEDRCRTPDWRTDGDDADWNGTADGGECWIVVADGMGGHGAGEIASEVAVETLARYLPRAADEEAIVAAILEANGAVHDAMTVGVGRPGMGTTIVGVKLGPGHCTFFNVGDSRAYLLRDRKLTRHSVDHTPNADGSRGARSHALTQSLGGTLTRRRIAPHVEEVATKAGDTILLCTDGLTDLVEEHAIASVLGDGSDNPASALTESALDAGGRDNVTVATIRL